MKRNKYILQIIACCLTSLFIIFTSTNTTAQPANDLCASATALACGAALTGEDTTASTDQSADVGCTMGAGAWYTIIGTGDNITIDITNDAFDVEVAIASGACGGLTNLSCTDGGTTAESATFTSVAGTTYYIYVGDWSGGGTDAGTFDLGVTCVPPPMPAANDMCADAVAIPVNADLACGTVLNATIFGATDSGLDTPPEDNTICGGTEDDDVWFSFVATNTIHQIDLTNITGSTTDLYHSVWEGSCGALTNIICSDPNTSTLIGLTPGNTYYVRIYSWTATTGQDSVFDVCIGTPPPPPPGDECTDPIAYPGDVVAGTCVTGFDFTPFSDNGMPSPTCDFGGDAVAWFSWTAPIVSAAGDPIDFIFDDGDGQATDCNIGIEAYETDCTTPASNCLGNISGNLTGLIQGTDYVLLIYQDAPATDNCDFCLTIACTSPTLTATAVCQVGDESGFYVEVDITDIGLGNTAYTVDVGGPQANITATGITTYGPFPSGTPIDVVLTGVDDATCGFTLTGLDRDCSCPPDLALAGPAGPYCTTDAAVAITFAPTAPFMSSVTITNTADGAFDGEVGFGLYPGTWDDGIALGLPPAGTGLFGTDTETSLEGAIPNDGATNPDVTTAGNFGGDPLVPGFSQTVALPPGDYTIYLVDDFGDGWNGTQAIVTDECGNVITTEQIIEDISADTQDEVAWVNFTLPIQPPVITLAGNGVVQTADPDGLPNSGDETYEFDPSQVAAVGCDPVTETLTLTTDVCGVICEATIVVDVFPPAQAPTITRDNDVCNYTIAPACPGDVLDIPTATAAPGEDPAALDVTVTTANGCMAIFPVDPAACPPPGAVCDGLAADPGIVSPIELCDGDGPIDVCFLMVDETQGINFDVNIDGAPAGVIIGVPGANLNELCIQLPMVANQTCDLVSFNVTFNSITCDNGDQIAGPASPSLADDLNAGGGITINVYPTLTVNTAGDATCGMLTAELVAADNTVCATAAGSPFMCTADGDVLAYDFSGNVTFTPPAGCPLPTLSGTLTCANCDAGATCTLMAPACNACPDPACDISTTIDLMTGVELNDAGEFSGAVPAVFPDYDITTNMGTLTLPMGSDQIFAVSGVTGLSLPNNVSEVCLTMDINVISGEIPFLLEFRIENGIAGQQLQFNTMVDGLGMCSVGGNLADAVAAAGFTFMNGASYAVVAAIADFDGTPVAEDLVVEISNIMLTVCAPDPAISGCTDMTADNYDPAALCDDGSCMITTDCTLVAPACNACPDPACEISTVIDIASGTVINDSQGGGATPVFPNYDNVANMGTLTLPAGGDMIYAVSGATDLFLPNNISEVCLTMDINVISGEIPFLLEFRIENGVPGQQLQFNTMVDGLGMCSVGGNFADAVPAAGFTFVNGANYAVVAAIADFDGTPVTEDLVVEISNIMLTVCAPDPAISGCTDMTADNYDPDAVCDDGSCMTDPTCPMCGACETPNEIPFAEIGGGDPDFSFAGADASDDGTQMILNTGANGTFAGHGWFIDQSAIPAGALNEDYCIFGDFNVIADPADLPLTIEFRIENNGVGIFIEFNTVVTTSGPVTIGGNLSTGNPVGPFDINGTAPALVIAIAIPGLSGNSPPTSDVIVEYSNVYITDGTCNPATIAASTISTMDPTRICIDGVGDPIDVAIDVDGGGTGVWVITDAAGIILDLPAGPPFDLDGAGAGQCLIWYANVDDPAFMPMVGDDATAAIAASSCAFLSNPITVDRIEVTAATISSTPASPITICTDNGVDEPINVTIDDAGIGAMGAWVITDAAGIILDLPAGPPFTLDGAGVGNCLIWWVNYDDPAFAPAVGDDAPAIVAAATCAALSNSVEVIREENCGTCEEEISYVVALDNCDFTGATIELFDDATGLSLGTMPLGANGGIGTFGLQTCGDYSFVINGAPICYIDAGGDVGPRAFSTDGTNDTVISFNPLQIPTLSQWGLIVLALLLMTFGALKIGFQSVQFVRK